VRVVDPYRSNSSRSLAVGRTRHAELKLCRETLHHTTLVHDGPPRPRTHGRRQANGTEEAEDPCPEGARQKTSSSSSARKRPRNPPETNERLPYKTIVVVVVVVGGDGSYALVHRGGGGPGTVDQDVLLLLFLRRGRCSCDSIIGAAAAAGAIVGVGVVVVVTPVTGGHDRRVGNQLAFQRHHDCTERVFVHVLTEYFLQKLD